MPEDEKGQKRRWRFRLTSPHHDNCACDEMERQELHIEACPFPHPDEKDVMLDPPHSRWCPCPVCIWPKGHLNGCKWQSGPGDCTCGHITADDLGPSIPPG